MDAVFKALSDPTRRQLLDTLRDRGGLTLTELEQGLGMTRFGVMKHLKVLEEANLVVTRRDGRFKYHYLNALPIQEVADRWMAPYAKPLARFALNLKNALESEPPMADKPDFVVSTYIRTTPDRLWEALTNPEITRQFYYGGRVQAQLEVGGRFDYLDPKGEINLRGEVLEVDPGAETIDLGHVPRAVVALAHQHSVVSSGVAQDLLVGGVDLGLGHGVVSGCGTCGAAAEQTHQCSPSHACARRRTPCQV